MQNLTNTLSTDFKIPTDVGLFSLDADFIGCTQESFYESTPAQLQCRTNTLVRLLSEWAMNKKTIKLRNPTIFGISIDPEWCVYPYQFMETFIRDFYVNL